MIKFRDLRRTTGLVRKRELLAAQSHRVYCPIPEEPEFVVNETVNEQWTWRMISYKGKRICHSHGGTLEGFRRLLAQIKARQP